MANYRSPGIYVEEISKFPPTVAQVETAIPAFVGYTAVCNDEMKNKPMKISSLLEYERVYGGAPIPSEVKIFFGEKVGNPVLKSVKVNSSYILYDSIRLFYMNGGGECYIVSVGNYDDEIKFDNLNDGLNSLQKIDRPTLIVIPETVNLDGESESGQIHQEMLSQCNKMQNRFAVLDIRGGEIEEELAIDRFRDEVGMNNLKYGAAYFPWLKTTLSYKVEYNDILEADVYFEDAADEHFVISSLFNDEIVANIQNLTDSINDLKSELTNSGFDEDIKNIEELKEFVRRLHEDLSSFANISDERYSGSIKNNEGKTPADRHLRYVRNGSTFHRLLKQFYDYNQYSKNEDSSSGDEWETELIDDFKTDSLKELLADHEYNEANNFYGDFEEDVLKKASGEFKLLAQKFNHEVLNFIAELEDFKRNQIEQLEKSDPVYAAILAKIKSRGIVLPPGGAIVGVYASVDNERGVWKAPANVSLAGVKSPAINITNSEQENLNIHAETGKSINAIRAFTGKGTLVWGARTLAGNDNEWKYVSVRRFFMMAETSIRKATEQFVFERNDANTWVKVRAMIENFLTLQWRAGALAGAKPDQAFYVSVGLGQTMTAQDVLDGLMNVEIGMAVVRPAEFIILKFSHKMQEA